jgi:hypothetical protein
MHLETPGIDVELALSSSGRLPVTARRLSQEVLLVLLSGRMWVRAPDGSRRDLTGPTWVTWYPGEAIEYGALGDTVHWVFAAPVQSTPPGSPRPGSLVRLRDVGDDGRTSDVALLAGYLDDSPDRTGPLSVFADVPGGGVGVYALTDVLEVVEASDEDVRTRDHGPGLDRPVRIAPG